MKINKTKIGVVLFIIILTLALLSEIAKAQSYIDIGRSFSNSTLTVGAIGYEFNGKWQLTVRSIGHGSTKRGKQEQQFIFYGKRVVNPTWFLLGGQIRPGIGIAHTPNLTLIGETNYVLSVEWSRKKYYFKYEHLSSADQFPINTGLDYVTFGLWL